DPEDVHAFLAPYHDFVRREFESFGGVVEKFIGDAIVALFGAPTAYGDDAERAVRAALAVRDGIGELRDLDVQLRIAVNTGEALVSLGARAPPRATTSECPQATSSRRPRACGPPRRSTASSSAASPTRRPATRSSTSP